MLHTSKLFLSSLLLLVVSVGVGCASNTTNTPTTNNSTSGSDSETISVVASFYPLAYLAEEIGGENVAVTNITPVGVDAHDFEPTAKDIALINDSTVLIYHGQGIDPWAERVAEDAEAEGAVVLEITESVDLLPTEETEEDHEHEEGEEHDEEDGQDHEEEEHADDDHSHEHADGEFDPHTWLDPVLMQVQAEAIRDSFIDADPDNAELYAGRTDTLITELEQLDATLSSGLSSCALNNIVVSHDAFGYMAHRYNFETIAISGRSPTQEPSAKQLAEITEEVEENNIEYIFTETLVSEKFANTIANETGADVLTLHPLEGLTSDEVAAGENYLSIMESNAANLATAMRCN